MKNKEVIRCFSFLLLFLFVISFVSAANWDNKAKFDKDIGEYGKYEVKNSFLGIDWFSYGHVVDLELKFNTESCVENCEAIKEVTLYQEGSLVDEERYFRFIDGEWVLLGNGLPRGSKFYYREKGMSKWKEFKLGDEFSEGTYEIKLEGSKKASWMVDWQIRSNGIWTEEWAVWGTSNTFENHSLAYAGSDPQTTRSGANITTTSNLFVKGVWKEAGETQTKAYIHYSNDTLIASSDFIGDVATFNQFLLPENYYITVDSEGALAVMNQTIVGIYPIVGTAVTWNDGIYNNISFNGRIRGVKAIEILIGDGLVTLNSPSNNTVSPTENVLLNCSGELAGGSTLVNGTGYIWNLDGSLNQTNTTTGLGGTTNTREWTANILNGNTKLWSCDYCDSDGDCGFASENRTVSVDSSSPIITLENPIGLLGYNYIGGNETLNVTFTDSNLDTCWYDYNGTNITIDGCLSGIKNSTTFILDSDNLNMTIYANDSGGSLSTTFISWDYQLLELENAFNPQAVELSSQSFYLTTKVNGSLSSAMFIYNGTAYTSNIISLGGDLFNLTSTIQLPSYDVDTNVTFYFNATMALGETFSTQENNQTVGVLVIGNCTSYSNLMFNISLFDEKLLSPLEGTIETDIEILNSNLQKVTTKSTEFYNITSATLCSNLNLTEATNLYNFEIRYYVDPENNSDFLYAPEFYHIQMALTSNLPMAINLYDLNINESTEFTISYRDNDYISRPNVLLQIQRKYVDEGIFRTVEIPITSSEGSATGHFDLNNYKYKIIATENGEVLNTFDNPAIVCESELSGICTLSLNGQGSPDPLIDAETINGIAYSTTLNDTVIDVEYVIPSGETESVNIVMTQSSLFSDPLQLCNQTVTSSSGSFQCTANSTIGDSQVVIQISSGGSPVNSYTVYYQEDLSDYFLLNNYAIAALFLILIVTMMVSSPKVMVIAATFSVAFLGLVFLLKGSSIGLTLGAISWLVLAEIIILIKINKKDES